MKRLPWLALLLPALLLFLASFVQAQLPASVYLPLVYQAVATTPTKSATVVTTTPTKSATVVTTTPTKSATVVTTTPTKSTSPDLPDLIVASMSIRLENIACLEPGSSLGLGVRVGNIGGAAAGPFEVEANGARQSVSTGLAAGQVVELWFPGYVAFEPNTAVADVTQLVAEGDETNNQRVEQVPIPTPPLPCRTPTASTL